VREIKFRAWDKVKEEFIYSDKVAGGMWRFFKLLEDRGIRHFETDEYIGLKDKNGKEIYEGDILLIPDEYTEPILDDGSGPREEANHLAPIVFKDGQFGVDIQESADVFKKGFTSFQTLEWEDGLVSEQQLEVIGNIYENPELLGVEG